MSVLIKGGKMPKNCDKCFLSSSMGLRCDAANKSLATDAYPKRPSWCPLVEVPTPHGRLIDANELCKGLMSRWDTADEQGQKIISDIMASVVTPIVVGTPTIIEAEEQEHE